MDIGLTRWRWADWGSWLAAALLAGAGWTLGSAIMVALLGLLK